MLLITLLAPTFEELRLSSDGPAIKALGMREVERLMANKA